MTADRLPERPREEWIEAMMEAESVARRNPPGWLFRHASGATVDAYDRAATAAYHALRTAMKETDGHAD